MNRDIAAKRVLSVMVVGIVCLLSGPVLKAADVGPLQVSNLFCQARLDAIRLREDANQMRDFVSNDVTWETHAVYANMIIEDIRVMRGRVEELNSVRSNGLDWQKSVIDRVDPLMTELAITSENLYRTMEQRPFDRTRYDGYLNSNYDYAERLAALLSDSVRYGKAKVRTPGKAK